MRRRFELREGTSNKFWEIERRGNSQIVRFGRMGTVGQTIEKKFSSKETASAACDKLILAKTRKGYREVTGAAEEQPAVAQKGANKPATKKAAANASMSRMMIAIEQVSAMDDVFPEFSGGAPESAINRVQKLLGLPITGSYREFVRQFGDQQDFGICGVNIEYKNAGTLWGTRLMRKEYGLPKQFLVVYVDDGHDEALALDCGKPRSDGEFPLYYFHPPDWKGTLTKVSDSFVEWFERHFELGKKKKQKTKQKKKTKKK